MATSAPGLSVSAYKSGSDGVRYVWTEESDNLNLRDAPSTSGKVIGKIPRSQKVDVLAASTPSGWAAVQYNGQRGYCSSQYLTASLAKATEPKKVSAYSATPSTSPIIYGGNPSTHSPSTNTNSMTDKTKKILKWGAIAVGVGVAGFVIWKLVKKNKEEAPKALSGVGRRGGYRRRDRRLLLK